MCVKTFLGSNICPRPPPRYVKNSTSNKYDITSLKKYLALLQNFPFEESSGNLTKLSKKLYNDLHENENLKPINLIIMRTC